MIPESFPSANSIMRRPAAMTADECADLPAFRDGKQVITAWRPSADELVKINQGAPIWLILIGCSMQPALVTADNPFQHVPQ